ncbi:LCP family protein [Streptomyces avicenniae]|uniref:LCP family protein n=1 Tax=Streptomyces avicenniae TaxID=500153 RepID=UPI00069C2724|nr:LCP family protein [Streptomyces avicenniae]
MPESGIPDDGEESADSPATGRSAARTGPADEGRPPGRAAARKARAKGGRGRKKPKPRWKRVLMWSSGSLALVVLAVGGGAFLYVEYLNSRIERAPLDLGNSDIEAPEANAAGQRPLNILLLGSDSRDGEENQRLGGRADLAGEPVRADVQILLHASADRSNATLISIPRDTQVPIPECTDPESGEVYSAQESASINTAMYYGGPGCVVATWKELTGVYIDHFMMVEFAGVVDMADAIGGVPVCVDANMEDPKTHLRLEEGENILEGEDAIQWLRTRYAFADGSDVGRTKAQQMYLSNMVEELQGNMSVGDAGQLMDLAEAAVDALTVDDALGSVTSLYDLGNDLGSIPNDRINMITLPNLPDPANPDVTLIPDPEPAEELFALVRDDRPIDGEDAPEGEAEETEEPADEEPFDPALVQVAVQNGTGADGQLPVDGRASEITDALRAAGFAGAETDSSAVVAESESTVYYGDVADQAAAEAIAEALGLPGSAVRNSTSHDGLTLVVGADWREGAAFPQEAAGDEGGEGGAGEPSGGGSAIDPEDIHSGEDDDCMAINPENTW